MRVLPGRPLVEVEIGGPGVAGLDAGAGGIDRRNLWLSSVLRAEIGPRAVAIGGFDGVGAGGQAVSSPTKSTDCCRVPASTPIVLAHAA